MKALESPWESIFFNDRKVKHEARPFLREHGTKGPSQRDVIVNFVRKPLLDGADEKVEQYFDEDSGNMVNMRVSIM